MFNHIALKCFSVILLLALTGCASNAPSAPVAPANSSAVTNTLAPQPAATAGVPDLPTIQPSAIPTPGANISFLFFANGSVQKYSLQNWSAERLLVKSDGDILQAALSPDQRWLAFQDQNGVKIVEQPFTGQPAIIPLPSSEYVHLLFSSNSKLLAFSDGEGLKIFDISKRTSSLLLSHSLGREDMPEEDVSKIRRYSPGQWSPDSEWLWIAVGHWEGFSHVLAHVPTKTFHAYSGCYSDTDWMETGKAFVAAVAYSGYLGCGEDDGIYLVELAKNDQVVEKRIYQETTPSALSDREPCCIQLSPNGENISFVQLSNPDTKLRSSRLMLIDSRGNKTKELDSSQHDIASPIWSNDGSQLFYTVQNDKESQVIRLQVDSGKKVVLNSVPNRAILLLSLPNSEWLIVGTLRDANWDSLYLVNNSSGSLVEISALGYDRAIQPFLGLWSLP